MGTVPYKPKSPRGKRGVEVEYQESKSGIIDPLPNAWLVSYTKHIIELQGHPNHRYESSCGRIPGTGADSNQILATLGSELERFRNGTVSITQDGLRELMGSGRSNDLWGDSYRYLQEIWHSAHHTFRKMRRGANGGSTIECDRRSNPRVSESLRNSLCGEKGVDP